MMPPTLRSPVVTGTRELADRGELPVVVHGRAPLSAERSTGPESSTPSFGLAGLPPVLVPLAACSPSPCRGVVLAGGRWTMLVPSSSIVGDPTDYSCR